MEQPACFYKIEKVLLRGRTFFLGQLQLHLHANLQAIYYAKRQFHSISINYRLGPHYHWPGL